MSKRRKQKCTETSSLRGTISPSRKKKSKSFRKRIRSLNNSVIQELSYELNRPSRTSKINLNTNKIEAQGLESISDNGQSNRSIANPYLSKTIDLCGDDSSDSFIQPCSNPSPTVLIDLSKDATDELMIVDENFKNSVQAGNESELTIVNLDEDEDKDEEQRGKSANQGKPRESNDDIIVIGTFNKTPLSSSTSNKINELFKYCVKADKTKRPYKKFRDNCNRENYRDIPYHRHDVRNKRRNQKLYPPLQLENKVGENVYTDSPVSLPRKGLRPIIIDGSNVAFGFSRSNHFSCKRLEICIKYFKERGHKVTAFVPQFRTLQFKSDDPRLLNKLVENGDVILTPSKRVEGKNIVPYDDRFIVQTAVLQGGIIVTRDNYKDLLVENPAWAETINYRTLPYTWVGNVLMFPKDPLGETGPSLEEFLRFN